MDGEVSGMGETLEKHRISRNVVDGIPMKQPGVNGNKCQFQVEYIPENSHVDSLWFEPTHLKNMQLSKLGSFPQVRDENKTYLSCHHLDIHGPCMVYLYLHLIAFFNGKCR